MDDSLHTIQESLNGVLKNFPVPLLGGFLRLAVFPLGMPYHAPSDATGKQVARLLLSENPSRDRLTRGVFYSDADDGAGRLHRAFHLALDSADAEQAIRNALNETVMPDNYEPLVQRAVESGVITEEQAARVRLAQEAIAEVIAVDAFSRRRIEGYEEPAFRPTVSRPRPAAASESE